MANVKNAILKKKIGDVLYELMVKTSSLMVYVDDTTTLKAKLEAMDSSISDAAGKLTTLLGSETGKSISSMISTAIDNLRDEISDEDDATSLAGKIKAASDAIDAINSTTDGILVTAKSYTDDKLALPTGFATVKAYVEDVASNVKSEMAGAFHYKGKVDYIDQLPAENNNEGDVYQVKYAGQSAAEGTTVLDAEYAWVVPDEGDPFWDELGSVVDLSNYYNKNQVDTAVGGAITTAAADATSKADTAKSEAIAAAAADATTKAGQALTDAKAYTDQEVGAIPRFIASATQPADLTENDIWAEILPDAPAGGEPNNE